MTIWRQLLAAAVVVAGALAVVASAGADAVTTRSVDVRGQGPGGLVVAEDGATLQRSDRGLSAKLRMPTPAPGSYTYPPAQTAPIAFPAAVPGHPEAYSLWMFVFNYPHLCIGSCDSGDFAPAPAMGGAFNAGGHVVAGPNLQLSGHVSTNTEPFRPLVGGHLLEPRTAEVHLAVAPHGKLDPALLPDQISKPIGRPEHWWIAVFPPPAA